MKTSFSLSLLLGTLLAGILCAQDVKVDPYAPLSAADAVRQGNNLLKDGHPKAALEAYAYAKKLAPEAPEITFAQGLAHYALQEYGDAREAFMKASSAKNPGLQNDARYSLATCDHAEALKEHENPKAALSMLEAAMQQYHEVLSRDPKHDAARDANSKAAAKWRELKQLLQQQQQQQKQEGEENEKDDEKDGEKQPQEGEQKENEKKDQNQEQQGQEQQSKENQKDKGENQEQKDQQQQESQQESEKNEEPQSEQEKAEQKKDEASREQAQRRLREMMQAVQQRKKAKPERVQQVMPAPVDKDW